jgi:hypothetical protein
MFNSARFALFEPRLCQKPNNIIPKICFFASLPWVPLIMLNKFMLYYLYP